MLRRLAVHYLPCIVACFLLILPALGAQAGSNSRNVQKPPAEEVLNNNSVIELAKVGLSEDLIIAKIQKTRCNFDLSTQGLVALKQAGISDRLLHLMMDPAKPAEPKAAETPKTPAPAAPAAAAPTPASPAFPTEIGVYIKKDNQWTEIQPEVVNWKTGGVLKRVATAGIVKGDVNGRINGAHSRNAVKVPLEFLVVAPEGVAITEYQLIHLREQQDAREFRTVTGGVLHQSSGATRDLLEFEGTKTASRTFSVNLPSLGAGEYGFLPPGVAVSSHASSSLGKMYTFRVE